MGNYRVDLGIKSFYSNRLVNFSVNRTRDYLRGYIINGKKAAKRNFKAGIYNSAAGHLVGAATSYLENDQFKGPAFRDGFYYYDGTRTLSGRAITLGNVVTGPNFLYTGNFVNDRQRELDLHERKHFLEQRALGPYYIPLQGAVVGGNQLFGTKPIFDCKALITTTYTDLGLKGCGG